jgi:hypothetical protein
VQQIGSAGLRLRLSMSTDQLSQAEINLQQGIERASACFVKSKLRRKYFSAMVTLSKQSILQKMRETLV